MIISVTNILKYMQKICIKCFYYETEISGGKSIGIISSSSIMTEEKSCIKKCYLLEVNVTHVLSANAFKNNCGLTSRPAAVKQMCQYAVTSLL